MIPLKRVRLCSVVDITNSRKGRMQTLVTSLSCLLRLLTFLE